MDDKKEQDSIDLADLTFNEQRYICTFLLHALGDTIGFKNGDWEFNYDKVPTLDTINEMIYEFIDLGGVNGIDLKDWTISDDTLYHIAIGASILEYVGKVDNQFLDIVKTYLIKTYKKILNDEQNNGIKRYQGNATADGIHKLINSTEKQFELKYDPTTGGNGCAMRNLCIGLALYQDNKIEELINVSIGTSKLTHSSPIGYLAGFTSAYFVSLAVRKIHIEKWPKMLIELLESDFIKKYVNINDNREFMDYFEYIRYWKKYIDTRFTDDKPIKTRSTSNMIFRIKYYFMNFSKDSIADAIGGSGFCAMIMAYDALIDCDGLWEKLVFYSMLHPGDSDTVGAIAGGLYGIVYGFGDVPEKMMCCVEKKSLLIELGKSFYNMFGSSV